MLPFKNFFAASCSFGSVKRHWLCAIKTGFFKNCQVHFLSLLLGALCLQGCAYGIYEDKRLLDTMADDKAMATSIKTELMKEHFGDSFSVSVYCFYGNVFLVGEAPAAVQAKALAIARSYHPKSVTPHWFAPAKGKRNDIMMAADLRAALIGTRGLSSTRIDTAVNGDRVVLLGVVHDEAEKQLAIRTARKIAGVESVTSYLMLPPKSVI